MDGLVKDDWRRGLFPHPVIKWAGGKRQLLPVIRGMMPDDYSGYYEPFFGGGALFFDVRPGYAVINDANPMLSNLYRQIRNDAPSVGRILAGWEAEYNGLEDIASKDAFYYGRRDAFNALLPDGGRTPEAAALLVFLNKAGFNGLYRVNKSGKYNVPPAHRDSLNLYDAGNFDAVSSALMNAEIRCGDFLDALEDASRNDFVFLDPPYYGTFNGYRTGGFSDADNTRLFRAFDLLSRKGAYVMLTNNDCGYIRELYSGYFITPVGVRRAINRDASGRTGREVIITNYGP